MKDKMTFRFPKERRLRIKAEYDAMFNDSFRISSRGMTIRYRSNGLKYSRLGMMVGKKSGNAVERNRLRRLFREVFRQKSNIEFQNIDLLITLYKPLKNLNNTEVCSVFNHLLSKITLQRKRFQA